VLKIPSLAFVLLLLASVLCIMLGVQSAGDALFGAYGAAAAILEFVLLVDVADSATAMERFAEAIRSGPVRFSGRRWTARRYRLLGAVYIVIGIGFAVVGWSGVVNWG
jgi:hypothetical protein